MKISGQYTCDSNGNFRKRCKDLPFTNNVLPIPARCTSNGFYLLVFCFYKNFVKFCRCQNTYTGDKLTDDTVVIKDPQFTCDCAQYNANKPYAKVACTKFGDFKFTWPTTPVTQKPVSPCTAKAKASKQLKKLSIPQCDAKGLFIPKQCYQDRCFCVDPVTGIRVIGFVPLSSGTVMYDTMKCDCASKYRKISQCLPNGNFLPLCRSPSNCNGKKYSLRQCTATECYCVHEDTGTRLGTYTARLSEKDKMMCKCALFRGNTHNPRVNCDNYGNFKIPVVTTPVTRAPKAVYKPTYLAPGVFDLKQCFKDGCFCVSPTTGKIVKGFEPQRKGSFQYETMKCDCASLYGRPKLCLTNGNFKPNCGSHHDCNGKQYSLRQCKDKRCHCVHPDTGTVLGSGYFSTLDEKDKMKCDCAYDNAKYSILRQGLMTECNQYGNYVPCKDFVHHAEHPRNYGATCDSNGMYEPKQCTARFCYCVNKYGHRLTLYINRDLAIEKMSCQCAVQLDEEFRRDPMKRTSLWCDDLGNHATQMPLTKLFKTNSTG